MTLLTGCEPNQLYIANHTVIGVNAAVNPEQTTGTVIVGYDRTFATVIPRSVQAGGTQTRDAMSALACSSLSVRGITIQRYTESLATGEAAKTFAEGLRGDKPGAVGAKTLTNEKDFFDCFKDKSATGGGP
jgi:hypothetical protein